MNDLYFRKEVARATGYNEEVVLRKMTRGDFPRSVRLYPGKTAPHVWLKIEIDDWVKSRDEAIRAGDFRPTQRKNPTKAQLARYARDYEKRLHAKETA